MWSAEFLNDSSSFCPLVYVSHIHLPLSMDRTSEYVRTVTPMTVLCYVSLFLSLLEKDSPAGFYEVICQVMKAASGAGNDTQLIASKTKQNNTTQGL